MILKKFTLFVLALVAIRESISFVLSEPIQDSVSDEVPSLYDHNLRIVRSPFRRE
ncbi:unnamed protein product, partial [Allacma fusca]